MKMEYNVQIVRGWPNGGALDRAETIKAAVTVSKGDWVYKQSDNTIDKVGATKQGGAGLVIQGNGDSASSTNSNKATVLWGNFIAQIKNLPVGVTFTPNAALTIQNAMVQLASGADPIVGYVLDVIAAGASSDASIVAKFN